MYHIAQNFGGRKLWWSWNYKKIGGENFGGWQKQSPFNIWAHETSQLLANRTLADWQWTTKVFSHQSFVLYGMHLPLGLWSLCSCIHISQITHVYVTTITSTWLGSLLGEHISVRTSHKWTRIICNIPVWWSTMDYWWSFGRRGLGGFEALAGYNFGDNVNSYTITGSLTSRITKTSNINLPGRWVFKVGQG